MKGLILLSPLIPAFVLVQGTDKREASIFIQTQKNREQKHSPKYHSSLITNRSTYFMQE